MKNEFIIIKTTYPNIKSAQKLAEHLLQAKLAACIQLTKINSIYSWQNKIENSEEISLSIKTKKSNYKKIEKVILKNHDYEVPQIFSIKIDQGFESYLNWIDSNSTIDVKELA